MVSASEPLADDLRTALVEHYRAREPRTEIAAWRRTLETNSGFAERRTRLLLEVVAAARGTDDVAGLRILDLGCGFGALSVSLAARGASVLGVDPNAARMNVGRSVAESWGLDARFAVGRMESLPDLGGRFDVAIANNSLCYVIAPRDRARALYAAHRALVPGGVLAIRDPDRRWPQDHFSGVPMLQTLPPRAATGVAGVLRRDRSVVRVDTPRALRRELRRAGFGGIRTVRVSHEGGRASWRYQHVVAERTAEGSA